MGPSKRILRAEGHWLAFSPDSRLLAVVNRDCVGLFELGDNKMVGLLKTGTRARCAFVPKRELLAIADGKKLVFYDLKEKRVVAEHIGQIYALDFSPDGQWMAGTLGVDGHDNDGLYVWRVDDLLKGAAQWWRGADE